MLAPLPCPRWTLAGAALLLSLAPSASRAQTPPPAPPRAAAPGAPPPATQGTPPQGYAPPPGYGPAPGSTPPQGYAPPQGYPPPQGYAPQPGYGPPPGYPPQGYGPAPGYGPPPGYAPPAPYYAPPPGAYGAGYPPMEPPVVKQPRSQGMVIGGIVLASFGGIGFIAGSALLAAGNAQNDSKCIPDFPCNLPPEDHSFEIAGVVTLVTGGIMLGVGIPLILYGSKRVPVKPEPHAARLMPEVRVGPRGGTLRWQF